MFCKECEFFATEGGNEGYCIRSGKTVVGDHEEVDCRELEYLNEYG